MQQPWYNPSRESALILAALLLSALEQRGAGGAKISAPSSSDSDGPGEPGGKNDVLPVDGGHRNVAITASGTFVPSGNHVVDGANAGLGSSTGRYMRSEPGSAVRPGAAVVGGVPVPDGGAAEPEAESRGRGDSGAVALAGRRAGAEATSPHVLSSHAVPRDCTWTVWDDWTSCSKSCGRGSRSRNRRPDLPAENGGLDCTGSATITQPCNVQSCPVDCQWQDWKDWGACSRTCGGGLSARSRNVSKVESAGGAPCKGNFTESKPCNEQGCAVDCKWAPWGAWTACTKSCGGGTKRRFRAVAVEKAYNGTKCEGPQQQNVTCSDDPCPQNCELDDWSGWTKCTKTCGNGTTTRTRAVQVEATHGGTPCNGSKREIDLCATENCPVDCRWSDWGEWSACSASCGSALRQRVRAKNGTAAFGGQECLESARQQEDCDYRPCPSDCSWSAWGEWSACPCGAAGGKRARVRSMYVERDGGVACPDASSGGVQEEECTTRVSCTTSTTKWAAEQSSDASSTVAEPGGVSSTTRSGSATQAVSTTGGDTTSETTTGEGNGTVQTTEPSNSNAPPRSPGVAVGASKGGNDTSQAEEVHLSLDKSSGDQLGLEFSYGTNRSAGLRITRINPLGLLAAWNDQHPTKRVAAGDFIVEVNGLRNSSQMQDELQQNKKMAIIVKRMSAVAADGSKDKVRAVGAAAASTTSASGEGATTSTTPPPDKVVGALELTVIKGSPEAFRSDETVKEAMLEAVASLAGVRYSGVQVSEMRLKWHGGISVSFIIDASQSESSTKSVARSLAEEISAKGANDITLEIEVALRRHELQYTVEASGMSATATGDNVTWSSALRTSGAGGFPAASALLAAAAVLRGARC